MKGKIFLAVAVCLFFVGAIYGQKNFRLDEATTKAFIKNGTLENNLVIENKSAAFAADVRVEILDANEKTLTQSAVKPNIKRGKQMIILPANFSFSENSNEYLWYRLRYAIAPVDAPENSSSGLISLSEIMPEI